MISESTHRIEIAAAYPAAGERTIAALIAAVSRFLFRLSRSTPISAYTETLQSAVCRRKPKTREQVSSIQDEPAPRDPHGPRPEKPYHDGAHTSTDSARDSGSESSVRYPAILDRYDKRMHRFAMHTESTVLHWLTPHESGHDWNLENPESRNAR